MPNTTDCSFGDIVLVPFPFSDQSAAWAAAGLLKPSMLKPVLTTVDRALIIRKLGNLEATDRSTLRALLDRMLGR